jgi:pimeloyl-ACP methyl ester carboxylesterase
MRATLAAPVAAVFAVAGSAAVWNAIEAWLARRRLRRGANLVRIRDRRVHVDDSAAGCAGTAGDITVVLDAGLGMSSLSWGWIRDAVSRAGVRVVSFDRPGLGRSPPLRGAPWLRRVDALVDQMHEVLAEVGATQRLVLVGHSSSGMHVRLYAHRHPDEVPAPPALLPAPPRPPPAAATAEARTARRGPLSCTASSCLLIEHVVLSLICTRLPPPRPVPSGRGSSRTRY